MKYRVYILISLIFFLLTACEKGYENEIFDEKYQIIYGTWEYQFTIGDVSLTYKEKPDHTIEFIPYGKFRYNNERTGKIIIVTQNENTLLLDFNSKFPNVDYANIGFTGTDTMSLSVVNGPLRLYIRKP
jgi:hypothetical protein